MVSPLYHPELGGVGRQAVFLGEHLHKAGVKTMVICRDIVGMPPWEPLSGMKIIRLSSLGNRKYDLEAKSLANLFISLSFSFNLMASLIRERQSYDIVHFHGSSLPLLINVIPLKLMHKRIVAKVAGAKMSIEAGSFRGKYLGIGNLFIRVLKKVDRFVAITDEIRDDLLKDGFAAERIFKTTNFIMPGRFFPVSGAAEKEEKKKAIGITDDRQVVTFSGRLVQRKRVDVLLKAVALTVKRRQDFHVLILGQGELMESMKRLAADLGLDGIVQFRGFDSNILDYLHATDIFLFTSDREGMPNSLLEAMACRLPVIATRIGGVVDIVEDQRNGLLVEPEDPEGLQHALLTLLNDRGLAEQLADEAYRTIEERFYLEKIGSRYIQLYESLL